MLGLVFNVLAIPAIVLSFVYGRRAFKGRLISRPLVRRFGRSRVSTIRLVHCLVLIGVSWLNHATVAEAIGFLFEIWLLDDVLTGGDDDDYRRRYETFKNKLRKLKPVRLRPAQRWAPA